MKRVLGVVAIAATAMLFAGCSSFHNVPYHMASGQKVRQIGLLTVATPPGLTVSIRSPAGMSFGLIGGLIAQGEIDEKSRTFTAAAAELGYSVQQQLTAALKSDLEAEGYVVRMVPADGSRDSFLNKYPKVNDNDVLLDVVVHEHKVGYRAAGSETKYYPYAFVTARLVNAQGSQVLYAEQLVYNPITPPKNARTIPPTGEFSYQDFDHLMANPEQSLQGLKKAVAAVASALARDLKPNTNSSSSEAKAGL